MFASVELQPSRMRSTPKRSWNSRQTLAVKPAPIMTRIVWSRSRARRRQRHEIAAQLADVLAGGDAVATCVVPEVARAETPAKEDGRSLGERARHHHHAAGTVVERQHAGDHVVRAVAGDRRHAVTDAEEAHVRETRRLGHAGRARSEDVEEVVAGDETRAHRRVWIVGGLTREERVQTRPPAAPAADGVAPGSERTKSGRSAPRIRAGARERVEAFRAGDDDAGARGLERLAKQRAAQIGVHERNGDAELRETRPADDELRAVLHEQRRDVAGREPARAERVRDAVRSRVQIAVGEPAVLVQDERALGMRARSLLDAIGNGVASATVRA